MVTRRQFTVTLVLTPIASWLASSCGGSDSSGDGTTSNTIPTVPSCDGVGARSNVQEGHSHELCVPVADLSSPPTGGKTYDTSSEDGHVHRVTLDAAQLSAVGRGELVQVTTSIEDGHMHAYALQWAAISIPPQPGGGSEGSTGSSGGSSTGGY